MIFGDINNCSDITTNASENIKTALEFLKATDFKTMEAGKYTLNDSIYYMVQDIVTDEIVNRKAEVHRKYIDIQYVVAGTELMGFARDDLSNPVLNDLLEEKDALFYASVKNENFVKVGAGEFAIFYPNDIHRPGCLVEKSDSVRKVVVKVAI